jgi:uncharacterized protein (DUF1684 family)
VCVNQPELFNESHTQTKRERQKKKASKRQTGFIVLSPAQVLQQRTLKLKHTIPSTNLSWKDTTTTTVLIKGQASVNSCLTSRNTHHGYEEHQQIQTGISSPLKNTN